MLQKTKVSEKKKKTVESIATYINGYPVIGIVNMENLPATQLQKLRAKIRDKMLLIMAKKRLIKRALEMSKSGKKGIEQLEGAFEGMPAMIFTKESPFKLSSTLRKNKSKAPIKPGQIAPNDIVVHAGATPFPPGPIISELSQAGIKTGVEGGKVAIKQDSVVAKAGEKVKPKVADVLARLGIFPVEVGLELTAVYENGTIVPKNILSVDESSYIRSVQVCYSQSLALAIEISYPAEETIRFLISGSHAKAKALAEAGNVQIDENIMHHKSREEEFFEEVREKMKKDEEIRHKLEDIEEREKEEKEQEKVEKFTEELKRKGTLKEG